ncbi:hypothetical protein B0H14DRAFT_2469670, partial [Mycena olivaceomarginata]
MKGLVGQHPSDMRRPGRASGPKQRGALDAIGVFQEIHVDGHEKLGERALRMGPGIGIDTYGGARPCKKGTSPCCCSELVLGRHH